MTSLEVLRETLDQLDLDSPYPGVDAEGPRGRAGSPKKPALPKDWLLNRQHGRRAVPRHLPPRNWTCPVAETRTTAPGAGRATTAHDSARWVEEPPKSTYRSDFERDRARVLHSSALRRLGAKTQVVAPDTDDFVRTRLTHSLEVAQVGRELGRALGCDPDVVDTACLSHDLGHPPFGHNGESALNEVAHAIGGFEGNAQTLRLLTRLEPKVLAADGRPAGLNLTRASLDAAAEVPVVRAGRPGHPRPAHQQVRRLRGRPARSSTGSGKAPRSAGPASRPRSWTSPTTSPTRCTTSRTRSSPATSSCAGWTTRTTAPAWWATPSSGTCPHNDPAAIDAALARLEATDVWVREADGSRKSMAALKDMTSQLIGRFCQSALETTRAVYGPENLTRYNAELMVPDETVMEIAVMKGLATTFVMTTEHRQPIYERQREVLHALVTALNATGDRHLEPMFAADWRDAADDGARLRVVIDQVASLTDGSALAMYERLVGSLPSLW